jgi:hypothetical protein
LSTAYTEFVNKEKEAKRNTAINRSLMDNCPPTAAMGLPAASCPQFPVHYLYKLSHISAIGLHFR